MPGGQFSHFRDKMSLAQDTVGQFRDDPGHSGTVGKPNTIVMADPRVVVRMHEGLQNV